MDSKEDYTNLGIAINNYGKYVIQQSKSNLTKNKKGGGDLYNSLKYKAIKTKKVGNPYTLEFFMENYGAFVDKGVKGVNSTYPETRAAQSKFQYGSGTGPKGGLTKGIDNWLKKKNFRWRDELGRFMTFKSMRYLIVQKIYFQGIKAIRFFSRPLELGEKKYSKEIVDGFVKDIDLKITFSKETE